MPTTAAIIPAYNEAERITAELEVIRTADWPAGRRCLEAGILEFVHPAAAERYGFEAALTMAASQHSAGTQPVFLKGRAGARPARIIRVAAHLGGGDGMVRRGAPGNGRLGGKI